MTSKSLCLSAVAASLLFIPCTAAAGEAQKAAQPSVIQSHGTTKRAASARLSQAAMQRYSQQVVADIMKKIPAEPGVQPLSPMVRRGIEEGLANYAKMMVVEMLSGGSSGGTGGAGGVCMPAVSVPLCNEYFIAEKGTTFCLDYLTEAGCKSSKASVVCQDPATLKPLPAIQYGCYWMSLPGRP